MTPPTPRSSAPIALAGAITAIYERVDVVMVSKLDSGSAAAIYSLPLTMVQYTMFVPAPRKRWGTWKIRAPSLG